ncbi:MAG: hypothetical protein ACYSUX_12035, partial [Planctomycetota bacterium]
METTKRIIILLIPVFFTVSPAQSMDKAAEVSGTRSASCLVKITCDQAVLPLNFETVDYLLHSSGVGGKAARDILNITPDQAYDLFTIEYVQLGISDDLGGVGIPPAPSRARRSGVGEDEYGMYDEMMMEYSDSPKSGGSSSVVRSTSRSQPGTGRSSSTRRTTTSRTRSATGASYSRRGRGGDLYGYMTPPAAPRQRIGMTDADTTDEQTYLFSLSVDLPEDVKPLAKEYMHALVENLRQALTNAYDAYEDKLQNMLQFAESRRDRAQSQLAKAMEQTQARGRAPVIRQNPADAAVYEQLE